MLYFSSDVGYIILEHFSLNLLFEKLYCKTYET